jgi:hypothetical protein
MDELSDMALELDPDKRRRFRDIAVAIEEKRNLLRNAQRDLEEVAYDLESPELTDVFNKFDDVIYGE